MTRLCSLLLISAFQDEELEAYRHEVRVFFGDEAYEKARTMEQCRKVLKAKTEDDNTPFLQVFNLWRRHSHLKEFCLAKRWAAIGGAAADILYISHMWCRDGVKVGQLARPRPIANPAVRAVDLMIY